MSLVATVTSGNAAYAHVSTDHSTRGASRLTRKERELLTMLMQNPGRCISREILLKTVWNYSEGARTRTVDVHVQRLRRKLGQEANSIKTIVRLGYCWFPEPDSINRTASAY